MSPTPTADRIGWFFPPTQGGKEDGFMDAGMEHFTGSRTASLAREIIQNSLDAQSDPSRPVDVSFEIKEMTPPKLFCGDELKEHVDACAKESGDNQASAFFRNAADLLDRPRMRFLRVSDRNTTGLRPKQWKALVKSRGRSEKASAGAGGSFGIGKSAPFTVSGIRTVLYWTAYKENGTVEERFQGVSILMTHPAVISGQEQETQGTGFLGRTTMCRELRGEECPQEFRYLGLDGRPVQGTSLWIAEMQSGAHWRQDLARSVVSNYFFAIQNKTLTILLEPDPNDLLWEINRDTLPKWFDELTTSSEKAETSDEDVQRLSDAHAFWKLTLDDGGPDTTERIWEDPEGILGRCRLRIRVGERLPRRVGLIRKSGMLITSEQRRLLRFIRTRDFAAVCVFESDDANEFLRQMENPKHDQFEPQRLREVAERKKGEAALRRFTSWVRVQIHEVAGQKSEEVSEELDELAQYLPDEETAGPFSPGGRGTREKSFGGVGRVTTRRPELRRIRASRLEEGVEGEGGEGEGDGQGGGQRVPGTGPGPRPGPGPGDGSGHGEGKGGTGLRGGSRSRELVPVEDVRVLAVPNTNRHRVSFTPRGSGTVRLELAEAGDSVAERRDDLRVCLSDGTEQELSAYTLALADGRRASIEFSGDLPVAGRSWRLSTWKPKD